jgi:hypothetical protein
MMTFTLAAARSISTAEMPAFMSCSFTTRLSVMSSCSQAA